MTERDYILERMTGPELEIFAQQVGRLTPRLAMRLRQWQANEISRLRYGYVPSQLHTAEETSREKAQDAHSEPFVSSVPSCGQTSLEEPA